MRKFSCRVLDFSMHIVSSFRARINWFACKGVLKKITRFVPLRVHLLEIRRLRSWNTVAEPKIWHFFLLVVFPHNIYICSENGAYNWWNPWVLSGEYVLPLFNIPNVMRWLLAFTMGIDCLEDVYIISKMFISFSFSKCDTETRIDKGYTSRKTH